MEKNGHDPANEKRLAVANLEAGMATWRGITVDVFDPQGEVASTVLFHGRNGDLYARAGSRNPNNLFKFLKRSRRLEKVVLCDKRTPAS